MGQLLVHEKERIRRAELRLEQFLVARDLLATNSARASAGEVQVNACVASLASLRSLLREHQQAKAA
jgi:hypothetical protein